MNAPKVKMLKPRGTNPATLHAALTSYVFALEELKVAGHTQIPIQNGPSLTVDAAIDYAREKCDDLLGQIGDTVARRTFALFGERPDPVDPYPMLERVREILHLEGWESDSLDEGIEFARDAMAEGHYREIFNDPIVCGPGGNCGGCGKCSAPAAEPAPSKRDAIAERLNALYAKRSPFVHGSPEWLAVTAELEPLEAELEAES